MIKHFYNHWNIIFKIVDFIITARKRCWIYRYFMKGACNFTKTRRLPYGYQQSQKYTSLLQKFCVMDNNLNTDCWFLYKNSLNFAQVNVSILNFAKIVHLLAQAKHRRWMDHLFTKDNCSVDWEQYPSTSQQEIPQQTGVNESSVFFRYSLELR